MGTSSAWTCTAELRALDMTKRWLRGRLSIDRMRTSFGGELEVDILLSGPSRQIEHSLDLQESAHAEGRIPSMEGQLYGTESIC